MHRLYIYVPCTERDRGGGLRCGAVSSLSRQNLKIAFELILINHDIFDVPGKDRTFEVVKGRRTRWRTNGEERSGAFQTNPRKTRQKKDGRFVPFHDVLLCVQLDHLLFRMEREREREADQRGPGG